MYQEEKRPRWDEPEEEKCYDGGERHQESERQRLVFISPLSDSMLGRKTSCHLQDQIPTSKMEIEILLSCLPQEDWFSSASSPELRAAAMRGTQPHTYYPSWNNDQVAESCQLKFLMLKWPRGCALRRFLPAAVCSCFQQPEPTACTALQPLANDPAHKGPEEKMVTQFRASYVLILNSN